jgi:serine protease Do
MGPTSGLVVAEDGYVLSSSFNFVNKPSSIFVSVPGTAAAIAKVVAQDTTACRRCSRLTPKALRPRRPRSDQVGQTAIARPHADEPDRPPSFSVGIPSAAPHLGKAADRCQDFADELRRSADRLQGRVIGIWWRRRCSIDAAAAAVCTTRIGFASPLEDPTPSCRSLGRQTPVAAPRYRAKSADNYAEVASASSVPELPPGPTSSPRI